MTNIFHDRSLNIAQMIAQLGDSSLSTAFENNKSQIDNLIDRPMRGDQRLPPMLYELEQEELKFMVKVGVKRILTGRSGKDFFDEALLFIDRKINNPPEALIRSIQELQISAEAYKKRELQGTRFAPTREAVDIQPA